MVNNADARLIRQQVFVEEQGFVNEFDDIDHEAYHAVIYTGGYPRKAYRGRDLGRMIVEALKSRLKKVGLQGSRLCACGIESE